ncbi:von_Willebrand factor type A domain-containing protein [Hexamita inflata]|uniref:von Willebrand factor type A domain-containing protein n=1 Tax=Hexamita inflata TaxID=28002 RepID=A0AA86Q291_9EUKA|nr:von Willebrand factor type A domain-containing protein [Hexamita inflata]CAI9950596.1 von Willebrand factor type A domain-containing protein [Hexamita inflata]CAI9950599.1 von Willebrand factor type A domain-containing protein [Hexamita inflata]CAI9959562.1 von Willebrand factor type A domain-containing protein [Hexamita inflata]
MREDLIEVVAILDMSGSMQGIANDTIGGFNAYVSELSKQEQEVRITLLTFNTQNQLIWQHKNVKTCGAIDNQIYSPNGGTALVDALGTAIQNMQMHISVTNEGEKPGKVSFFVSTDGEENSSRQFSKEQVQKMVTKATEDEKWEFIFAGANIDAFAAGQALGFQAKNIANIENDGIGQRAMYQAMACQQSCQAPMACNAQQIYNENSKKMRAK